MSAAAAVLPGQSARTVLLRERFLFFAAIAAACCAASALQLLRGPAVLAVVLAAIGIAMWHGAYDHVQAGQLLAAPLGRRWLPIFLVGYASLAGLTLLSWWVFPLASLVCFLAYSAWHFGTEPEQATLSPVSAAAALALGAVPIVAACRWHSAAVMPIFASMLAPTHALPGEASAQAALLTHAISAACWPVLAAALLAIVLGAFGHGRAERGELFAVTALQAALFILCDPLIAFAVYFCCWHTPEHLVATSAPNLADEPSLRVGLSRNLRAGFVPWLLSLALLAAIFVVGRHQAASYRAEIFIVLSALTVPHMALNELRRARNGKQRRALPLTLAGVHGSSFGSTSRSSH